MCRIQIAWDVTDLHRLLKAEITSQDIADMVQTMQSSIDSDLTTFQLKTHDSHQQQWAETNIYGSLIRETPASILEHCHLTVPLRLCDVIADNDHDSTTTSTPWIVGSRVTSASVRSAIVASLSRTGSDCIDDVQINFPMQPSGASQKFNYYYYLDLLDALQDLKREGLVRGVSARNIPSDQFLFMTQQAGFGHMIITNQLDANLLDPANLLHINESNHDMLLQQQQESTRRPLTVVASPLAGGWLTDRFLDRAIDGSRQLPPVSTRWLKQLSFQERRQWQCGIVESWSLKHCPNNNHDDIRVLWQAYHDKLLSPLQEMAHKHGVSIASVVLRWILQIENVASTTVACRLLPNRHYWDERRRDNQNRAQQLRQVFQFELDDRDMDDLWELSGQIIEKQQQQPVDVDFGEHDWLGQEDHPTMETTSGLFIPGAKRLWL